MIGGYVRYQEKPRIRLGLAVSGNAGQLQAVGYRRVVKPLGLATRRVRRACIEWSTGGPEAAGLAGGDGRISARQTLGGRV